MKKNILNISNVVLIILILVPFCFNKGYEYILLLFIPNVAKIVFKKEYSGPFKVLYYIYVFLTVYLGGCLRFYRIVPNYDTLMHTLSGFILTYIGLRISKYNNKNKPWFTVLFFFVFSMALASMWEIAEFSIDQIFNENWQRIETCLFDTMKDMCVHLFGTVLFTLWYLVDKRVNNGIIFDKLLI